MTGPSRPFPRAGSGPPGPAPPPEASPRPSGGKSKSLFSWPFLLGRLAGRKPFFALYIDCAGRASAYCGSDGEEAAEVQRVLGREIPLLGIYCGVEIARGVSLETGGNTKLRPERITSFELGYKGAFADVAEAVTRF